MFSGDVDAIGIGFASDRGCGARRMPCGTYLEEAIIEVHGSDARLGTGSGAEYVDGRGRDARVVVGRAEHVLAGGAECEAGWDTAGYVADVLLIHREVK